MAYKKEYGVAGVGIVIDESGQVLGQGASGSTYYVDGNSGSDSANGKSWKNAFKTLEYAFSISHADIARGSDRWARRNRIYIAGDRFTETLVAFPQKTDVIGVGSCDAFKGAGILGNHAPVNTCLGTRFYNINWFPAASGDIITLTSSGSGTEFHNCGFVGVWGSYTAPSAIDITAQPMAKILKCNFNGAFSGDVIDIGAGDASGMVIEDNTIVGGANDGIVVTGAVTVAGAMSLGSIKNNYVQVAGKTIVDGNDNAFIVSGNRCVSAGASTAASYEIDEGLAVDNVITYNDGTSIRVPIIPSA